ncbi:MAG: hypothetical protein KHX03_08300 [Clostridium sp.]|nr:hypothetical protein [Clostridium sp.]
MEIKKVGRIVRIEFKSFVIALLAYLLTSMSAFATKLPDNILQTIKSDLPKASVRFDGLITLPDGTVYIPVLPSNPKRNAVGKVVSTYPANKKLAQLPDVVVFDSNYAFLKVIKTKDGKLTVTASNNIPFIVKTGLLPQDMLVPPGLIFPEDMQIMLGDLKVALKNSSVNNIFQGAVEVKKNPVSTKIVPVPYMAGRTLLVTSLDSKLINVIPSDSTTPKFTLKMENLPKFIQPVCNDDYILIAASGKTYIDVADVKQEVLARKIDLAYQPSEIILTSDKAKAYVAVDDDQSIFLIDLKSMTLVEKIKIKGYPKHITISADDKQIAYIDKNTGDIYTLTLDESYTNKFIYNASNISKLIVKGDNIYALSRTEDELLVIDNDIQDIIYKQPVAKKPVDMFLKENKLYILCASNELDIFNLEDFSMETIVKLPSTGFSKKLVQVPNTNILLITNVTDKKYLVYDMKTNTVLQTVTTPLFINDLQLINKRLK